jgi:BioD-like phosphotransacetylase family protein
LTDFARKGLKKIGVELLGVLPRLEELENPTLSQICNQIEARFINGGQNRDRPVTKVIIGAMSSRHAMDYFKPGTLVITPGDREDLILAALSSSALVAPNEGLAGIILADDLHPHYNVLEMIRRTQMPVMVVPLDSYSVASRIHDLTIKTRAADTNKVETIRNLVRSHLDIDKILKRIAE